MVKTCTKCGETKHRSEFYAAPGSRDGFRNPCKVCKRAAARQHRKENPELVREAQRAWRLRNPQKVAENHRKWRESNKEYESQRTRAWKRNNPDAHARHKSKARAKRYGAEHEPYSRAAVFERWGSRCCYCDGEATTLDHVTPLGFGGHDVEANVVPACARCNSSKGRKTLAKWAGLSR